MADNDIKLSDMPKIADEIKDLLGLIILITEDKTPQLKKDVAEIVDKIQGGINLQQLKQRTQTAVNEAISNADFVSIKNTAQELKATYTQATRSFDEWSKEVHKTNNWTMSLMVGSFTFIIGAMLMWGFQYKRIDRYQYAINKADQMAVYVNQSCDYKKDYAKFIGQNPKSFDCADTTWRSASDWYADSK